MLSSISVPQLAIIALIVILIFGTKKLRNLGSDLGGIISGFRKEVAPDDGEEGSQYGVLDAAKDVRKARKTVNKVKSMF